MSLTDRRLLLPLGAIVAVLVVLGINLAAGGASYGPRGTGDPCAARSSTPAEPTVDAVAERVVIAGIDESACKLGITRERLLLALASPEDQNALAADLGTTRQELAMTLAAGLRAGVARLDKTDELPKVSALLPSILEEADLPDAVTALAQQVPASVIDSVLPTGPVLQRAVDSVDYRELLAGLDNPDRLEPLLRDAIRQGAVDEVRARINEQLGGGLGGLL